MDGRSASLDDLAAIVELHERYDTAWFGSPENDEDDVRKSLGRVAQLAEHSRLIGDGVRLLAAAWWGGSDATLLVDPDADPKPLYADLLPWLEGHAAPSIDVLSQDERLLAALDERRWRHIRSSFELIRAVTPGWTIAEPQWPRGISVQPLRAGDTEAVHRLIYVDARWTDVPGHPDRAFAAWRDIFLGDDISNDQQVLAWRGERLVGVAIGKIFSDGTGWVAQLAVAMDERTGGLGTALLLEALRRRVAAGATSVGLGVQAENSGALGRYLRAGLVIDREWREYEYPRQ
jgi:mycothiol synthase